MGRPRKNKGCLVGRAGRQLIELEDLERDAQRWRRRKEGIAKFSEGRARPSSSNC